jgi:hypothetical protein
MPVKLSNYKIIKLKTWAFASPTASRRPIELFLACRGNEKRQYHCYQGCTFYEGCSQDHVSTDVAHCFWLAGDAFYGFTTNRSYTDTGADGGQTCSNCCVTHVVEFDDEFNLMI